MQGASFEPSTINIGHGVKLLELRTKGMNYYASARNKSVIFHKCPNNLCRHIFIDDADLIPCAKFSDRPTRFANQLFTVIKIVMFRIKVRVTLQQLATLCSCDKRRICLLYTQIIEITSQRGSAWHCYIGHMLFNRKNAILHLSAWKNQWIFCNQTWQAWFVGKIYKLTKFGEDRLRNGASIWWWNITVLWLSSSTFFRFLGQPTGRNFGPNCTLNGSKVAFRLIHVPFEGLVPSNLLWGGQRSEKPPNFDTRDSLDVWKVFP